MKKFFKILVFTFILYTTYSITLAGDWNLPWITIISRAEWWADESIRLTSYSKWQSVLAYRVSQQKALEELKTTDPVAYQKKKDADEAAAEKKSLSNNYLKTNYSEDWYTDDSVKTYNWQSLRWTQSYKYNKTKIIIHHSASDNTTIKTKADAINYIQHVYKYHTLDNAWWDIWYNFIIDPFGNIYEGRAGWEWVIWAHAKRNNTPSIWICLIWNFENVQPTKEAMDAVIQLSAALAKKYNINPMWYTSYHKDSKKSPYIESNVNYNIAWHKDAGTTACPWKNVYNLLPYIRSSVYAINHWETRESSASLGLKSQAEYLWLTWEVIVEIPENNNTTIPQNRKKAEKLTYQTFNSLQSKIDPVVRQIKQSNITANNVTYATSPMNKIVWKIDINQAKSYLNQNIQVLLYELTQEYDTYKIECIDWCTIKYIEWAESQEISKYIDWVNISVWETLDLDIDWKTISAVSASVKSNNDIIIVTNYDRKSYAWVPRNRFHGELIFKKDYMKDENGVPSFKYVVINSLPFSDYMKWIVETNDTESQTKNELMALISKSYALFYMHPDNQHPNIPVQSSYNAVDNPNIFQKYVWAGLEKTLTKRYKALKNTENKIVMYDWYVPILPYFSCSAWFTYSASEKRWRVDTPYLTNKFDIWICDNKKFYWHWVWLSWLWAERWASTFGRSYSDILQYYYPWIEIINI